MKLKTFFDRNVIFIHYLSEIRKVRPISGDALFTCYKKLGEKLPGHFWQSIRDTATKKWFVSGSTTEISLTNAGMNRVKELLEAKDAKG